MKRWGWFAVAGALFALWYYRRKAATKDGQANASTYIGQVGAKIEQPQALQDFARALEASSEPRVLEYREGPNTWSYNVLWSDGRWSVLDTLQGPTRPLP